MLDVLTEHWSEFSSGFWVTVRLVAIAFVIAMVVGTLVAALRIAPSKWLQRAGGVYVEIFRNIPLLVLLFISYAGLRRADVNINAWVAGTGSLGLYTAAYGDRVLAIEYADDLREDFAAACAVPDRPRSMILRDRDLAVSGAADYVYEHC